MEIIYPKLRVTGSKPPTLIPTRPLHFFPALTRLIQRFNIIGTAAWMSKYEQRKLAIFNQLNLLQLITGILVPVLGLLHKDPIPTRAWLIAALPACTSLVVLLLNGLKRIEISLFCYFLLYPFLTCLVYLEGLNAGTGLNFVFFGIFSVFFLSDIGYMLFTVLFSMLSYFVLEVVLKQYLFHVEKEFYELYLLNHSIAIVFIFYGLYLLKQENAGYQFRLVAKNRSLHKKNLEIKKHTVVIEQKALLLSQQKGELQELNTLKSRLFSVIAHDLKTPIYALRNLFQNIHRYNMPAEEVKSLVPDVVTDLNYTIGLMENLLQWSKSQMQDASIRPEKLDMHKLINDVIQLLRLQAGAKQLKIESQVEAPVFVTADREMIHLVLRNLLSNAIKFTPENGRVSIGVHELPHCTEIFVQDTGLGISEEGLKKIQESVFFTTRGTASESGTGLGLMLCREFLLKNGGQLHIESKPGEGSVFSFTLPQFSAS